jgi:hypothetical protein
LIIQALRDRLDRINACGGTNLIASNIPARHRSIGNVTEPISDSGTIAIPDRTQDRITTAAALHCISRDKCTLGD